MDQFDPWQVVPRQVFSLYSRLLISTAFVVFSRVGCLGITGIWLDTYQVLCLQSFLNLSTILELRSKIALLENSPSNAHGVEMRK